MGAFLNVIESLLVLVYMWLKSGKEKNPFITGLHEILICI